MDLLREGLLDRLTRARQARLVLIQAPAGYGKSTLLRQMAEQETAKGGLVGWITPASHDVDLSRFVQLFAEACEHMIAGQVSENSTPRDIVGMLKAIQGPALFLIDEYDQFASEQVDAFLRQLINQLPEGVQIGLAARTMPNISGAKLKLDGRAVVLGSIDLRFDLGEAFQFMSDRAGFGLEEVRRLHMRIDGWPAAFQFVNLALHSPGREQSEALAFAINAEMVEYLAQEVFDNQPKKTQDILLVACLPDRICNALIAHIIDGHPDQPDLEKLCAAGLFIDPVGGDKQWFRFHPLFGDYLRAKLTERLTLEQRNNRHIRIAEWLADHDMDEMAISHFVDAGKQEAAAELLERVSDRLIREERLDLLIHLVERLDQSTFLARPLLVSRTVIAYGFRRNFARAHQLLDWCELRSPDVDQIARAERDVQRCFILAAEDSVQAMGEHARDAAKWLTENQPFSMGVALNAHAFWLGAQSQFTDGSELLLRARPLHDIAQSYFGRSYADSILGGIKAAEGKIGEAVALLSQSLTELEKEAPRGTLAGAVIAAHLGDALYEQNQLTDAERIIGMHLPLIQQQCIVDPLCLGVVALARISALNGRHDYAHELFEYLISAGHRYGLKRLVACGRAELVREATLKGDIETAERRFGALGPDARLPGDGQLMFPSGELEGQRITYARLLVHSAKYAEARAVLQGEIRTATVKRRLRRLVRLKTLLAVCLSEEGQHAHARRVLMEAIHLAHPGGMVRIFLDEGPIVVRLLNMLATENLAQLHNWSDDPIADYVRTLLAAASTVGNSKPSGLPESDAHQPEELCDTLTAREIQMVHFLAQGHSNSDLADRLSVSANTVKFHLRNVFAKLGVSNRMQAVQAARHFKLID